MNFTKQINPTGFSRASFMECGELVSFGGSGIIIGGSCSKLHWMGSMYQIKQKGSREL